MCRCLEAVAFQFSMFISIFFFETLFSLLMHLNMLVRLLELFCGNRGEELKNYVEVLIFV